MTSRRALFAYCILAMIVVLLWGAQTARQASRLYTEQSKVLETLKAARYTENLLDEELYDLMQLQRESRLAATPQEAIELSTRAQSLQDEHEAALSTVKTGEAQAAVLDNRRRHGLLLLVPAIALLLLHAVGAFYLWPVARPSTKV
jgi:hypothetical protein